MNKGDEKQKAVTRRRFFLITWGSLFAGTLLSILSSIRFLFPNILYEPESKVEVERPEEYPLNGAVFYPEHEVYLLRDEKGIYAMSGVCTHLACMVKWIDSKKEFLCSCHGSVFSKDGKVRKPPAKLDLKHYKVSINRRGRAVIHKAILVDRDFRLIV